MIRERKMSIRDGEEGCQTYRLLLKCSEMKLWKEELLVMNGRL